MNEPSARALLLHTGGTSWVDVSVSVGPRTGPLVRWLGAGWGLELGSGLAPALDELDISRLADGRAASAFWLQVAGERPAGTSADLVLAAAILLRARASGARPQVAESPEVVVTGSGSIEQDVDGSPRVVAVQGWPEKLSALAARLPGLGSAGVLLLHPADQERAVVAALADLGLTERVRLRAVDRPASLVLALDGLLGEVAEPLPGWPTPSPEAARVLKHARGHAGSPALGYFGVEHVAQALIESGAAGIAIDQLRRSLWPALLRPPLSLGVVVAGASSEPLPTPRLLRLGARLLPGFGPDALARALCEDSTSPLHVLAGGDLMLAVPSLSEDLSFETVRPTELDSPAFCGHLEVQGGPEDGRRVRMGQGEILGRWAPQGAPHHALYETTRIKDRALSRSHLEYVGYGRVRALQGLRALSAGAERVVEPGEILQVNAGDALRLTAVTRVMALPE